MIFWRGKALYLYSTRIVIRGSQGKPREDSDSLEDDSEVFRKFPVPEGTLGKGFWRLAKLRRSHKVGPSRVESMRLELVLRTRENAQMSSRMALRVLGKFPVAEGTFGKDFWRLPKLWQSHRVIPSRVEEAWTLSSSYGNWVQTQQSHFGQGFGGFTLDPEVSVSLCDIPK